jgi:hypothetical protein
VGPHCQHLVQDLVHLPVSEEVWNTAG